MAGLVDFNALNPAPEIHEFSIGGILTKGGVNIIDLAFFVVGISFMGGLIVAAVNFVGSQGDPKRLSEANSRIINSLLGLAITFAAFVIVKIAAGVFNYSNIVPF